MAMFQTTERRVDETKKRSLNKDDIAFLSGLQRELNTQDTMGNRDPRFWVIKQSTSSSCGEDEADETCVMQHSACEIVAKDLDGFIEYLTRSREDGFIQASRPDDPERWDVVITNIADREFRDDRVESLRDLIDLLERAGENDYSIVYARHGEEIVPDTLFLTHAACEDHLRKYAYNYASDAHAYAMTAVRSPEFERVIQLLQQVDWGALARTENGG